LQFSIYRLTLKELFYILDQIKFLLLLFIDHFGIQESCTLHKIHSWLKFYIFKAIRKP